MKTKPKELTHIQYDVFSLIKKDVSITSRDIARTLDIHYQTARHSINRLKELGYLTDLKREILK